MERLVWTGEAPWKGENAGLVALTLACASRTPDRIALIDAQTGHFTRFGELGEQVKRTASSLSKAGFRRGEVVATLTPNTSLWVVFTLATWGAGGVISGINPVLKPEEIVRQLKLTGARLLAVAPEMVPMAEAAGFDRLVDEIIVLGMEPGTARRTVGDMVRGGDADAALVETLPDDVALLPFSSGTGGFPKGVEVVARSLSQWGPVAQQLIRVNDDDILLAMTPFFHIAAVSGVLAPALALGLPVVILQMPSLEAVLDAIARYRVTMSVVTPPLVRAFAAHPAIDQYDLSSLRVACCTAAPLSAEVQQAAARRIGASVVQVYAMTESVGPITFAPLDDPRPGSVGKTAPGVSVRIVDPVSGADCGTDIDGEVWFQSPIAMRGYRNDPVANADILVKDGWYRTGDIGRADADGYLTIVDRLKEMIKVGSAQVAPAELEAVIASCPGVADVAVAGRPDAVSGERPVAFVVRSRPIEADTIVAWVAERVAAFKQVASVEFVDAIPRQPTGKIMRRLLGARANAA